MNSELNHYNIRTVSTEKKFKILAKFFAKTRIDEDQDLNILFSLEDHWDKIYYQNRVHMSFDDAKILANEGVITKVMSENNI